jgi:hypothetical protein
MEGVRNDSIVALDEIWEKSRKAKSKLLMKHITTTPGETTSKKSDEKNLDIHKLSTQLQKLNKRSSSLEERFLKVSTLVNQLSNTGIIVSDELLITPGDTSMSVASKTALSVIDHDLITSKPRDKCILYQILDCIIVVKRFKFAMLQSLLIVLALSVLLFFGAWKFIHAHNCAKDPYKPFKVDSRDNYYRNEELTYILPLHYFWFELAIVESNFRPIYNETFNEICERTLEDCLSRYMINYLNPTLVVTPTEDPTSSPSLSPSVSPSKSPTKDPTGPGSNGYVYSWDYGVTSSQWASMSHTILIDNTPLSATCLMSTSRNGIVTTETVGLRNLTVHIDKIGVNKQKNTNVRDIFGMLLRMEFEDFGGYMSGKMMCDLYLQIGTLDAAISDFATFDIFFMVSREEYSSGTTGITEYIRSMKKVWRRQNELIRQVYSYVFEENTFDKKPDFTAEVSLVDEVDSKAMLNIEVYPYPIVVHYITYDRYSYLDWLADVGGFFTLVLGFFLFLTSRVTKLANRKEKFHLRQGILPAFSLPHRNAEELSGLRLMLLAALGITEQEYFSKSFDSSMEFNKAQRV